MVTNCSLLALELGAVDGGTGTEGAVGGGTGTEASACSWLMGWVALEHLLLLLFLAIDQLISDTPAHVKLAMDKTDFFFKHQAVKVKQD